MPKTLSDKAFTDNLKQQLHRLLLQIKEQYKNTIQHLNNNKKHLGAHGWTQEIMLARITTLIAKSENSLKNIYDAQMTKAKKLTDSESQETCLKYLEAFSKTSQTIFENFKSGYRTHLDAHMSQNATTIATVIKPKSIFARQYVDDYISSSDDESAPLKRARR